MESVEVGERKSRTVTYATVGIGFEVTGARGLAPYDSLSLGRQRSVQSRRVCLCC